jgi:hypothetical protein
MVVAAVARAIPKSATFAVPDPVSSTFCGLIAVYDPALVRGRECPRYLDRYRSGPAGRQVALLFDRSLRVPPGTYSMAI